MRKGVRNSIIFMFVFMMSLSYAQAQSSGGQIKRKSQATNKSNYSSSRNSNPYYPKDMEPYTYYMCINETWVVKNGQDLCRKMAAKGYDVELMKNPEPEFGYHVSVFKTKDKSAAMTFYNNFSDERWSIAYPYYNREYVPEMFSNNDGSNTESTNEESNLSFSISPTCVLFPSTGGSKSFYVDSKSEWQIFVKPNYWGSLTKTGNQLTLTVNPNNEFPPRSDYFCIKSNGIERRVSITQEGSSSRNNKNVTGEIKNVWVDYNATDSYGNYGIKIHIKFDIYGMLNRKGSAAAYFYYSNGEPLRDTNGQYRTTNGNVATHVDFTPTYENCTYNDLTIFMPTSELHLSQSASCYFTISIWNGTTEVVSSEKTYFDLKY